MLVVKRMKGRTKPDLEGEEEAKLEDRSSIALYDLDTMFMCVWYSRMIS